MITNMISIEKKTIEESPTYDDSFKMLKVDKVIITKDGMESGSPSLDFQLTDEDGNKYLVLMTGNIFRGIAIAAKDEFKDGGVPLVN